MKSLPFLSGSLLGIFLFSPLQADDRAILEALHLTDAKALTELQTIYQNPQPIQSEAESADKATRIRELKVGAVGRDRLLIEVDFDHPPVMDRSSFCLYVDADCNLQTGRNDEGAMGVDVMGVFEHAGRRDPYVRVTNPEFEGAKMAHVWDGNKLFITLQTRLPEQQAQMRVYFLSTKDEGASNNRTPESAMADLVPLSEASPELP